MNKIFKKALAGVMSATCMIGVATSGLNTMFAKEEGTVSFVYVNKNHRGENNILSSLYQVEHPFEGEGVCVYDDYGNKHDPSVSQHIEFNSVIATFNDTPTSNRFSSLLPGYYQNSDIIAVVYDANMPNVIARQDIQNRVNDIRRYNADVPIVLVGMLTNQNPTGAINVQGLNLGTARMRSILVNLDSGDSLVDMKEFLLQRIAEMPEDSNTNQTDDKEVSCKI